MNNGSRKNSHSRKKGARSLGEFTPAALGPAAAKLGFGEGDIILHWPDIAGERLAQVSEPERLQWPVRGKKTLPGEAPEPAALVLRVEGAFAIEIQHLAPLLIERINTRLGWRCIGRIMLRQGPVRRRSTGRGKAPPPTPQALAAAGKLTDGIAETGLRDALTRLGARALENHRPASTVVRGEQAGPGGDGEGKRTGK
ncbi:MAG: DUF721 domain-containing protein [Hyphomicrobiales bacterium]|nr:DUF721 domain-containing protein [Hyphomicrobiales bacterium]